MGSTITESWALNFFRFLFNFACSSAVVFFSSSKLSASSESKNNHKKKKIEKFKKFIQLLTSAKVSCPLENIILLHKKVWRFDFTNLIQFKDLRYLHYAGKKLTLITWFWMIEFEWQIHYEFTPHSRESQSDFDRIRNNDAQ